MKTEDVVVLAGNCRVEFMPAQSEDVMASVVMFMKAIFKDESHGIDDNFKDELGKTKKQKVSELKMSDLVMYPGLGVYLFYNHAEKKWWYVGKNTSKSFIERIPSHYDTRASGWVNTLTKRTYKFKFSTHEKVGDLSDAAKYCVDNLDILLINFKCSENVDGILRDSIIKVERQLIGLLQPELQLRKRKP
ncbi:MAG: hypothetical protein JRN15_18010 [Nitrososphaerota archaeon]|nr:hypothetical protein [Nitrososphaerota archaeon]